VLGVAACLMSGPASAAPTEPAMVKLDLKDHRFTPSTVTVPAGRPVRIVLSNQDAALEEFDSQDLGVEKDVTPHGQVSFTVGPLKPGRYSFMGELHADTASGELQAVEAP
jgi:hypothetical protein